MHFDLSCYESLGEAFWKRFLHFKSKVALIEVDRDQERLRLTYEEVGHGSRRIASALQERGFLRGDRCAILMSNQSKWLLSGIGAIWAGGVLVPLDYRATAGEQCAFLSHCEPKALIVEWPLWERLRKEVSELPKFEVFVTDAPPEIDVSPGQHWESCISQSSQYEKLSRDDTAAILYSSGTGGRTKGCMLSHGNYLSQVQQFHAHAQFRESDRYFSVLPTNHAVDFVFGFLYPLLRGCTVVHQRTLRPQYLVSTLRQYQIDVTTFVPLILQEIRKGIEKRLDVLSPSDKRNFQLVIQLNRWACTGPRPWLSRLAFKKLHAEFGGRIRLIMTGGTLVSSDLVRFFHDLGFFVGIGYGLTEAGTAVSAPLWNQTCSHADNVGKILPDTKVQIRQADEHGVGEIWIRSPSIMKGYFKDPELTEEVLIDGWLRSDDLGSLDSRGFLKIRGRLKNMIITGGGKNVYPEDIEASFEELPGSTEQCVFATHYIWPGVFPIEDSLFIVVHPRETIEPQVLANELRSRNRNLTDYKRISGFIIWPHDFPRVSSLKIKRHQLAQDIELTLTPDCVQKLR